MVNLVVEPIVGLELNPRSSKQVQRRRRLEVTFRARHELLTEHPRTRRPQLLLGWLLAVLPGKIPPEPHTLAAHARLLKGVELAIRVASVKVALVLGQRLILGRALVRLGGCVAIVEVVAAKLGA